MKRLLTTYILIFFSFALMAQVRYFDERYTSTMANLYPVLVNPGATGTAGTHQVIVNYKNKWATFSGAPKTYVVSYDGSVADRLGLGVSFLSDVNGSLETSKVQGALSYSIDSPDHKVTGGISAEYINHGLKDEVLTHNDIVPDGIIDERVLGNGFFDVSLGMQGIYLGKVKYGIALPSLVSSRVDDNANDQIDREFGFLAHIGYSYTKEGIDATFEPSLFVKKLNYVPFHADINLLGRFADDKFRGGISYTVDGDKKIGFLVGVNFNALSLNYSYNASRQEFQTYNNGTHEFSLRFDIGGTKKDGMDDMMEMPKEELIIETMNK